MQFETSISIVSLCSPSYCRQMSTGLGALSTVCPSEWSDLLNVKTKVLPSGRSIAHYIFTLKGQRWRSRMQKSQKCRNCFCLNSTAYT